MADITLSPTNLVQPEIGASEDSWGTKLNADLAIINTLLTGISNGIQSLTPTLTAITPPTGVTYTFRSGSYIQIGKLVVAQLAVVSSSLGTGGSGTVRIGGLPFASVGNASAAVGAADGISLTTGESVRAFISDGTNYVELRRQIPTTSSNLDWALLSAATTIYITVSYFVA